MQTHTSAIQRVVHTAEDRRRVRHGAPERLLGADVNLHRLGQELGMRGEGSDLRSRLLGSINVDVGDDHAGGALFGEGVAARFPNPARWKMG